jgi:hypothetical protein
MGTPTNSILYYMQCIGRVVRDNPDDLAGSDKVFVLQVVDNLPNIQYRIDNRWLYADISDYLEPEVRDELCVDQQDFHDKLKSIFKEYRVVRRYEESIPLGEHFEDISLLLINGIPGVAESNWRVQFVTNTNRRIYVNIFNNVGDNIDKYYSQNHENIIFSKFNILRGDFYFGNRDFIVGYFEALKRAYDLKISHRKVDCIKYITFSKKKLTLMGYIIFLSRRLLRRCKQVVLGV